MARVGLMLAALVAVAVPFAPVADALLEEPASQGEVALATDSWDEEPGAAAQEAAEHLAGTDLDTEDVDLALTLDIVDTEFDLVGILLNTGEVDVSLEATAHVEFTAVAVRRIERAMEGSVLPGNLTSRDLLGVNASRMIVTAEEMRLAGAVVLESFQRAQARYAIRTIEKSLPGVSVVSSQFAWSNAEPTGHGSLAPSAEPPSGVPGASGIDPRHTGPPLVMDAAFELQYLDRLSLIESLLGGGKRPKERPPGTSAFELFGVHHVLDADVPQGWRGSLAISVPKGFTIVSATEDIEVREDLRTAMVTLDGELDRDAPSTVTFSSRFLVVSGLLVLLLGAGFGVRVLVEPAVRVLRRRAVDPSRPMRAVVLSADAGDGER